MSATKGFGRGLKFDLPAAGGAAATAPTRPAERATGLMRTVGIAQDLHALRAQVEQLEKERGAQPLDPRAIRPSRWANRHADSFNSPEFEAFKAEIADAGGNVQPIKVRPLAGEQGDGVHYEIVFGHRRHRACLDLGLQVLAVVQELDERSLWTEMERENRARANLSAWEQGTMYRRALDAGLFPSVRMLAKDIGRDATAVSEALRIADLPAEVVAAFRSPNDIQFRWAKPLADACAQDLAGVLTKAKKAVGGSLTPAEVLAVLTAQPAGVGPSYTQPPKRLDLGAGATVKVRSDGKRTVLEFDAALLPPECWPEVERALRQALKRC